MEQSNDIKFIPSTTSHRGLKGICVSGNALSPTLDGNFQCLEATRTDRYIRLRVLLNITDFAVNVTIPTSGSEHDICYYRYLRYLTRNYYQVRVHFDELLIKASKMNGEIVLCADDYVILDSIGRAIPCILDIEYFSEKPFNNFDDDWDDELIV